MSLRSYVYTLNTDKMVKAYRCRSVFSVKCLKWKFLGLQYACNLRINLCYRNSNRYQLVLERGKGVYSKINEVLLHHYFLLQWSNFRINIWQDIFLEWEITAVLKCFEVFFLFVFTKTFLLFFLSHKRNYLNVMYVSL